MQLKHFGSPSISSMSSLPAEKEGNAKHMGTLRVA